MATAAKLNKSLISFIESQHLFFVATAAPDGRVNLSPKGLDSLRVKSSTQIVWMNLSGSGNETAAHLRLHPRMTLMFCAFAGEALILRVYGNATTCHPGDADWTELAAQFPAMAGARQIFALDVDLVQTSCGSGVPLMAFAGERGDTELLPFYDAMGPDGVRAYWQKKNTRSIDGFETGI